MKEALEKKDLDLAAAKKEAREKTKLADQKLQGVINTTSNPQVPICGFDTRLDTRDELGFERR